MGNIYLQAKIGIFDGSIPAGSIKKCQVGKAGTTNR